MEKGLSEAKVCFDPCDLRELFIVLSFRISGNFPLFHLRDFGQSSAIPSSRIWRQFFRHSAIPPFRHSAIPPFRHSAIPPFRHSAIPPFLRTPTRELLRPDNFFQLVIFGLVWMMRQRASLTSLLRVTDHKYRIRRQVQNFWYSLYVFLEDTFDEPFSKITLRCSIAHFSEKSKSSKYS